MKAPIYPALKTCFFATILFFLIALLPCSTNAAGVTIITHGFDSDANGWVAAMADAITNYHSFPGTNFTMYEITLTTDGSNYYYQWVRDSGSLPSNTDSGEIIIKLDWSQMAGTDDPLDDPYDTSTYSVAAVVSYMLLQTNVITELNGHPLVEYPLHLIGHSRGGSLMNEVSYILGTNGVWVDHLTTLDPHPFNNDGNEDFLYPKDASASNTWENVLFRDDYWQNLGILLDPDGESASGAYNRHLNELPQGYLLTDSISPYHSNVHLWYYGTIDWNTPTSYNYPEEDDEATIDAAMRTNWWVNYEQEGTNAGFEYSLIGGGNRMSMDEPVGQGFPAVVDGYNQNWNLGAGIETPNRTALPVNSGMWPNIIKFNITGTNVVTTGDAISTTLYYQYGGLSNVTIHVYLDKDLNPYNSNSIPVLAPLQAISTGAGDIIIANLPLTTTNVPPGTYSIYAQITDGAHTRYLYTPEQVDVVAFQQAPAALAGNSFGIDITGGTPPFATNGYYLFLPASAGDNYQVVGLDNVQNSSGTYSYSNAGAVGTVNFTDSVAGSLVGTLSFSTATSGGFHATNAAFSSYQSGNFGMFPGQALDSIAGQSIECTVQDGLYPFADTGSFTFQASVSGNTYVIVGDGVNTANSSGTYSYSNINASTGVLQIDDSVGGALSAYMAFSTASAGEFAAKSPSTSGFQIATFVIADASSSQITMSLSGNLAFGNVTVGSSAQSTLTISNTGNSTLTVSSINYPTGFSGNWSGTIAAGASQPVTVTFSPTAATIYGVIATVNADNTIGVNLIPISGIGVSGDSTLTIVTNGDGTVSPNLNGKLLIFGKSYTLTAVPGSGNVFSNWTGNITTNKNPLTIKAESNMVLEANFIPNPFLPVKGTYNGLFFNSTYGVTEQTAGMLKGLTISQKGTYSGTLLINGASHAISGSFDLACQATNHIARAQSQGGPLVVEMTLLNSSNSAPQVAGTVSGTTNGTPWVANLTTDQATNTLPSAEYVMLIPPNTNSAPANSPGGDGYALITNYAGTARNPGAATAKITGALADGTAFNQTVPVSQDGYVPIYVNLYASKGLLLGWINLDLTNTAGVSLTWIHPRRTTGLYENGFTNVLLANQILLSPWTNSPSNILAATNLSILDTINDTNALMDFTVTISNNFKLGEVSGPTPLKGSINPKTGLLKVIVGSGATETTGYGAVLLNATNGGGYFLTKTNAGAIILEP
jgi:hypothetical protein